MLTYCKSRSILLEFSLGKQVLSCSVALDAVAVADVASKVVVLVAVCAAAVNANVLGGVVVVKTLFRLLSVLYFSCWNYCGCEC